MSKHTHSVQNHIHDLADDTRALLATTADVAEEKVTAARKRMVTAMEAVSDACAHVQKRAVEKAKIADKAVRANPYKAVGIALGVGDLGLLDGSFLDVGAG